MIYLDHNATTPLLPAVRDKLLEIADAAPLNPSSAHSAGERASYELEIARGHAAALLGAEPGQLVFTSGGTEANNAVLAHGAHNGALVTSTIEHSSVLAMAEQLEDAGVPVCRVEPDADGRISADAVAQAIDEGAARGPVGLVSIQWVNNETGVIQPIEAIAETCRSRGVAFHSDAAQAVGKVAVDVAAVPVDFLTFTGHKFHAPTGVGAVYVRRSIRPWSWGGEQEQGRRAGTENLLGIAALGEAARCRYEQFGAVQCHLEALRDHFETVLVERFPWVTVNGGAPRVANTSNLQFGKIDGEALLAQLDAADVAISQASACASQRPTPSHVLLSMGRSEREAFSSVRFSFGETNTEAEIDEALSRLTHILERLVALEALA